jgi:ASC-1-like (ASCH) protein
MKLASIPFGKIISGKKVIESRLYDEKRQTVRIGDQIMFSEKDRPENSVTTIVVDLLRYQTFKELFSKHDPTLFGAENRDFLLCQIKEFYSDEEEREYGVLGIRVKLKPYIINNRPLF